MEDDSFPILEYSDEREAIIEPATLIKPLEGMPLYGGVNLDSEAWDNRGFLSCRSVREKLVELAAEACLELTREPLNGAGRSSSRCSA